MVRRHDLNCAENTWWKYLTRFMKLSHIGIIGEGPPFSHSGAVKPALRDTYKKA